MQFFTYIYSSIVEDLIEPSFGPASPFFTEVQNDEVESQVFFCIFFVILNLKKVAFERPGERLKKAQLAKSFVPF